VVLINCFTLNEVNTLGNVGCVDIDKITCTF
jgi:hypothetical protein